MTTDPALSPGARRAARDAARRAQRRLRRTLIKAVLAGWEDDDASELNLLDEAATTPGGASSELLLTYGAMCRLIDELARATGEEREHILRRTLSH